ncbi:LysR family transcriptional regulator [Emcibacter nanhaiensis]|uniref:LysR family transcriptional regulator n=1 Tax=Emcibacter nanhaiensis TaxID=1505037 RepID=A0A501PNV9_9PROT|nr:LysR family transcriptional regulator [Emcibacter nanhaiensis]TPD61807.1 LysR family transcriptional regulator [Emcibacter nanhaiensis]
MIELYQLRYFLAVVETGSFTKAAERVYVTQPTLSAGIQKLEAALDTKLFDRSSKRVFLTESGSRFVDRAKAILHQVSLAEAEMGDTDNPKILRLGVLMTIPAETAQSLLQPYLREEGGLVVELFEGTEQEILNRLDSGQVDIALTILRPGQKGKTVPLYRDRYSLAIPAHHPLAEKDIIQPRDLADAPTIVRSRCEILSETSRFFTDHNVRPRLVYRTPQDERALMMVAAGIGFTTMPDQYTMEGVARLPMEGYDFERQIGLIWTAHHLSPEREGLLSRFSMYAKSQLPDLAYKGNP